MAFFGTLRHHLAVAREAWADERRQSASKRARGSAKRAELAFLPAALEITETPAAPLGRAIAFAISAFFIIAIAWATMGEMDIIATATGKIIPSERVKMIQPLETGVVRAIHVRDGARVEKGDVLIELDPTGAQADQSRLFQELTAAGTELARLTALLDDDPESTFTPPSDAPQSMVELHRAYLVSQVQQQRAERAALEGEISKRRAEISTVGSSIKRLTNKLGKVRERYEGSRKLFEKGIVAKLKFAELEEELLDVEGQLDVEKRRLTEARVALKSAQAQSREKLAAFRRDTLESQAEARQKVAAIEQELVKADERNRLQTLLAPVSGTVQQLDVHTVGGVVTPAQPLMQIVPAGAEIEVEAMILNKDIGFVHGGQEAELKVESFPFTKYGTIPGKVRHVYADAIEDERVGLAYPARIKMARSTILVKNKHVDLTPGMAVTVEIKTGKRRIIDYILAPLQEYQDESLREQ